MTLAQRPRLGFTILELVVLICIAVVVLFYFLIPVTIGPRNTPRVMDASMQRQIHMTLDFWGQEHNGQYPLPGLINRLPDPETGLELPDKGPQDYSLNHTAPLYSAMIALNYLDPDLLISPLESVPYVVEKVDYDYEAYDPAADSYWDTTFSADLRSSSNTSYAHMALCGERRKTLWRNTAAGDVPMFGNRGPRDGATSGAEYDDSITLQFIEPDDEWVGTVVFADNHVEWLDSLEPAHLQPKNSIRPFNLFRMDGGALGISIASTEDDVTRVWDPIK